LHPIKALGAKICNFFSLRSRSLFIATPLSPDRAISIAENNIFSSLRRHFHRARLALSHK
jgi:hypothetical protein